MRARVIHLLLFALLFGAGCATNPVTGKREISFLSEAWEVNTGRQSYLPLQQAQGGAQNTFPEVTHYVNEVGHRLVGVSDRPHLPYEFVVLNNSVPNAWALPGGKIAVNRGLLVELGDEAELAAVLGHETVHAAARHGAKNAQRTYVTQAGLVALGVAMQSHDYRDLILGSAAVGAQLAGQKYSREAEFESDKYGIRYMADAGYDPGAAVDLQETFVRLYEGKEPGWLTGLFASHPPSRERVEKNREIAATMPGGGDRNKETYDAIIAPMRAAIPAYDDLEKGAEALDKGRAREALRFAEQAIDQEPREGHFYNLAAKAKAELGDTTGALRYLDKAIERNAEYFDYHLQKGLIHGRLGNQAEAKQALARSTTLLPTAQAHHGLGILALDQGNRAEAIEHFRVGASNPSPAGKASYTMLAKLDLPQNPQRYIQIQGTQDSRGYLALAATNRSPVPVDQVTVNVAIFHPDGALASRTQVTFPQVIPAGETARAPTRIGPFSGVEHLARTIRLELRSARVRAP